VVVFDKVRENTAGLLGGARSTYSQAANLALNQTLVRSINTSLIALLPVTAILVVSIALLGANNELEELALVLFVGMLSGTYSSICIATPVLADLKEREPQYQALAKRVSVRTSGGRAAQRAAAKARAASGRARIGTGATATAATVELDEDDVDTTADPAVDGVYDDDLPQPRNPGADLAASGRADGILPAARSTPVRPGPRQQPRRSGSPARHRPTGKKKRR
jgi:preprotein translocase subunit SecF